MYKITFLISALFFTNLNAELLNDKSQIYRVKVDNNLELRVVHTKAKDQNSTSPQKVVILLPGRASFFEKNKGLILGVTGHDFSGTQNIQLSHQSDFWCIDMRAHGGSQGRLTPAGLNKYDQRGHVDSFETYLLDIQHVIENVIAPYYQGKNVEFYLMGSSLGAHLALRYLQKYKDQIPLSFKRILLITPMIRFKTDPWPRSVASFIVKTARFFGFSKEYALGYGDLDLSKSDFTKFKGHHNRKAFDETNEMLAKNPRLITGGPTFGWAAAAFDSEELLLKGDLPKGLDIIAYIAGQDTSVDTPFSFKFCKDSHIRVKYYPHSRHNILKETKEYAPSFWSDLDFS